jgi:MtrB/PioB family decaheme-associated outer membrane protein
MRPLTAWRAALVTIVLVCALAPPVSAQVSLGGFNAEGDVAAGFRFFADKPSDRQRGKFEEYRDLPAGALLDHLNLRLYRPDESYSVDFGGDKWGQKDQHYSLGAGRLGLWQFGFDWDQIPHIYSTTGRTLAVEIGRSGQWTLPTPRPNLFNWNRAPDIDEISQRWDTMKLFTVVSPTPDIDLKAEYTRIHKSGERPFGVAFGSPGNNFLEILEPISQTIQDFRLRGTLARDNWQLQAAYSFSMFNQGVRSVVADNPCFGLAAAVAVGGCGADGAPGAPSAGRMSVEPDNMAHTFSLSGGISLPLRTRITASVSYSLRLQDEGLLAHTINPAIVSPTLALPEKSADRSVGVTVINLNATTRPVSPLTLSARYRLYDNKDMSSEAIFPGHVINDRTLVVEEREALRWGYTRQNFDADARWRFGQPAALILGGGWERWDRVTHREVPTTDEFFGKAVVDVTPVDWFLARLTYRPSFRRIDEYNTFAHHQHQVLEDLDAPTLAQGQSVLLRKFDEADRDRQAGNLTLTFTPLDTLSVSLVGEYSNDRYLHSDLGLQDATRWGAGLEASLQLGERAQLFGGYMHELILQKQRSRSRIVVGATTFDFADFDWISVNRDTVDTIHVGADVALIPGTLTWRISASYAYALGEIETRNPFGFPSSGTAAQNFTASAKRMPAFEDTLLRLDTAFRYHINKAWTATLLYAWESFDKRDWRTDTLNPFQPGSGSGSIWLGNDARNYSAHIIALTIGYQFK